MKLLSIEINLRKKWLFSSSYSPRKNKTSHHLNYLNLVCSEYGKNYDYFIFVGNFNANEWYRRFLYLNNYKSLIKKLISSIHYEGIRTLWAQKSRTRKTDKSHSNLELHQVIMYYFLCQNILIFPIFIYYSQKDVSVVYEVLGDFELKKSCLDLELYQAFMYNFLCKTALIFPVHITQKNYWHILVRGCYEILAQKIKQKKLKNFINIFELYQVFVAKVSRFLFSHLLTSIYIF